MGAGQGSALCKGRVLGEESTSQVLMSLLQDLREVLVSSWFKECACMLSGFSRVRLFATLWTVDRQAPLSRQEYWSGLPFHSPVQRAVWQLHETTRRRDLAQGLDSSSSHEMAATVVITTTTISTLLMRNRWLLTWLLVIPHLLVFKPPTSTPCNRFVLSVG